MNNEVEYFDYQLINNNMKTDFLMVSWTDVKSALVSALVLSLLAILSYIVQEGSIFDLDFKTLINIGVMAGLVSIVSLLKSFFTTNNGNFLGAVNIK